MAIRQRVSLYFVQDDRLLLIYRWKNGRSFHVLPGGGVEPGETLLEAALREAKEETNFEIELGPLLWQREPDAINEEFAYLVKDYTGDLKLGGPEAANQSPTNIYRLEWVPLSNIEQMDVWPGPVHVDVLRNAM
ncbi:MAG: NUDIX domain-containing protein [Anaerolineales bacterium]|nr:NUDIX domain-containing protein [Anaerolineales bacterium]MCA9929900.1 NUDIX domain-containing protein [Anaerolineales bacterium]